MYYVRHGLPMICLTKYIAYADPDKCIFILKIFFTD